MKMCYIPPKMSILASTIFLFFGQKCPNVKDKKEAVVKNTDSPINGKVNLKAECNEKHQYHQ